MKKIITFLIVLLGFTISFASTPDTTSVSSPTEITQVYYPGVHYTHIACCIPDKWINGLLCYDHWYSGINVYGQTYYYFNWQPY